MARSRFFILMVGLGMLLFLNPLVLQGKTEPKQTPENTISLKLPEPVKPQTFPRPLKFLVVNVIDRTGDPRPMLVSEGRGGIFFDRDRTVVVRQALEDSLRAAGMLAPDEASADFLLTVYLFQFGLAEGSGFEIFTKLDMNVVVKSRATGKSQEVPALGTSIEQAALRKKNIMKRAQASLEECLTTALRNFLRGVKLREAIESLSASVPQS
jgi:hypothetical protein